MGTGLYGLHPFFISRNFEVLLFLNQSSMTKKHFEALAETVASLYKQWTDESVSKAMLIQALIDELSTFCFYQNSRFDRQRFEDRVLELVKTE